MNGAWRVGNLLRRRRTRRADTEQAVEEYLEAALALHNSPYRNLRQAAANVPIFFAFVSAWMILLGDVTPMTLPPLAVMIIGGVLGIAYYFVQNRPGGWRLLVGALVSTAMGLTAFVVARKVFGQ
ncbi:hypothetical protein ABT214_14645 [Micromonospora purpureochromogenes]|uniref:hypothetical protein n=1 Tax=Micromonospora purpureochromogenes TaxID=47872 RepID=UPI0033303DBB